MQALDSFISSVPSFDGDIPISAIPVLTRPLGDESMTDPSAGVSASTLKAQANKQKATVHPTPPKKARKSQGNSQAESKLMNPHPMLLL
jgi:hypothetical protein